MNYTMNYFRLLLNLEVSKEGREKKNYRSHRSFNIPTFNKMLSDKLSRIGSNSCNEFEKAFLTVLTKQAPLKTKLLRQSDNPFMTKKLPKTIMKRSQQKNRYNKSTSEIAKTCVYIKNKGIFV